MAKDSVILTVNVEKGSGLHDVSYHIQLNNYVLSVKHGDTVTWDCVIILNPDVSEPVGHVWVVIQGFLPTVAGTPATPFGTDNFRAYGFKLNKVDDTLTGHYTSDPIDVSHHGKWEYTIYLLGDLGVIAKIDPMLVISG